MKNFLFLFIILLLFSCSKKEIAGDFVIIATKIFDGKTFSYEKKFITIKGEIVVDISDTLPSTKMKIIDIGGKFLLPGLIDGHTHLFYEGVNTSGTNKERLKRAKEFKKEYLGSGFVGLVDLGNSGQFLDVDLREEDERFGPTLLVSGPGIAKSKAQMKMDTNIDVVKKE